MPKPRACAFDHDTRSLGERGRQVDQIRVQRHLALEFELEILARSDKHALEKLRVVRGSALVSWSLNRKSLSVRVRRTYEDEECLVQLNEQKEVRRDE